MVAFPLGTALMIHEQWFISLALLCYVGGWNWWWEQDGRLYIFQATVYFILGRTWLGWWKC
jgi:hypothetical protein